MSRGLFGMDEFPMINPVDNMYIHDLILYIQDGESVILNMFMLLLWKERNEQG